MKSFVSLLIFLAAVNAVAEKKLTQKETDDIIKIVDDLQNNNGDYKSSALVKETERNKEPRLFEAVVHRRSEGGKFMILFTGPKEEAGKAYLKIDRNLWNFDPSTGKWERRTEREKLAGTNSRRSDFDDSRLALEYNAVYEGEAKLGKREGYKFKLTVKEGKDVAYPVLNLVIEKGTNNILKRDELALSGKLMRTTYYPNWEAKYSESKKAKIYYPTEMFIIDQLEKGNTTKVEINNVDLNSLPENIFTKAWIESKSR